MNTISTSPDVYLKSSLPIQLLSYTRHPQREDRLILATANQCAECSLESIEWWSDVTAELIEIL